MRRQVRLNDGAQGAVVQRDHSLSADGALAELGIHRRHGMDGGAQPGPELLVGAYLLVPVLFQQSPGGAHTPEDTARRSHT